MDQVATAATIITPKQPSSPVTVSPHAKYHAHQRAGQERGTDEQPKLGIRKSELPLDLDADDGKDRPYSEAPNVARRGDRQDAPAQALGVAAG